MRNIEAEELFKKFKAGTCSDEELETIYYWLHNFRSTTSVKFSVDYLTKVSDDLWISINNEIIDNEIKSDKIVPFFNWRKISAAAAVLLFIISGLCFFYFNDNKQYVAQSIYKNDVNPGGNKAYLTLSSGRRVSLSSLDNNTIAEGETSLSTDVKGTLTYKQHSKQSPGDLKNTLTVPNGGRFQVKLPDGTNVTLNSGSSLTYPVSFVGNEDRIVTLEGEGYFEVAHDNKHPFLVHSGAQTVQVLGTHFNIQAYLNEQHIKTTLISGSVKVYGTSEKRQQMLRPGEQSVFKNDQIKVSIGDIDQATGWISDDFVFAGDDLYSVMRAIARWYDVQIDYQGPKRNITFYSTISRRKKLSQILNALTLNNGIHFKIEGRRVTVMP